MFGVGSEDLRPDGPFLLSVIKIATSADILAELALARNEFGHDQAATTQPLNQAAEDSVRDSGHGCQDTCRGHVNVADAEFLEDHESPYKACITAAGATTKRT